MRGKLWRDRMFAERSDALERLWEDETDEHGGLR